MAVTSKLLHNLNINIVSFEAPLVVYFEVA